MTFDDPKIAAFHMAEPIATNSSCGPVRQSAWKASDSEWTINGGFSPRASCYEPYSRNNPKSRASAETNTLGLQGAACGECRVLQPGA